MAHLLPPAGVTTFKDEAYMFNSVRTSNFLQKPSKSAIPPNIHDFKWTNYKAIDQRCKKLSAAAYVESIKKSSEGRIKVTRSEFNPDGPCPMTVQEQFRITPCPCPQHHGAGSMGGKQCHCLASSQVGGGGQGDGVGVHPHTTPTLVPQGWGFCPPVGLDPRCLIRPRDKSLKHSIRPTGNDYFTSETKASCTKSFEIPQVAKGVFTFDDWFRTQDQREPPAHLKNMCIPSVSSYCPSKSAYCDPLPYTLAYRF